MSSISSEMFRIELWSLLETPLCERGHGTIVLLTHEVVDRTTWTELGLNTPKGAGATALCSI